MFLNWFYRFQSRFILVYLFLFSVQGSTRVFVLPHFWNYCNFLQYISHFLQKMFMLWVLPQNVVNNYSLYLYIRTLLYKVQKTTRCQCCLPVCIKIQVYIFCLICVRNVRQHVLSLTWIIKKVYIPATGSIGMNVKTSALYKYKGHYRPCFRRIFLKPILP